MLADERPNPANRSLAALYSYPGGISDFLQISEIRPYRQPPDPVVWNCELNGIKVAAGFQFPEAEMFSLPSFVNSSPTILGGTHVQGFLSGLVDGLNRLPDSPGPIKISDLRNGLNAFVAIWLNNPRYRGATKDELGNPEVETALHDLTSRKVHEWAINSGDRAKWLIESLIQRRDAKEGDGDR